MKSELMAALAATLVLAAGAMELGGEWRVTGEGVDGIARLPGTLADAGLGAPQSYETWNAVSNKQERYALRLRNVFIGQATWSRKVTVPPELSGKPLELFMERVMWESTLKVDGRVVGSRDSLGTPHVYSFEPDELTAGEHLFELVIDNTCHHDFSGWAHAWGPTTQTRWNGVIGRFELREASPLRAARVFAPWPAHGRVEVEVPPEAQVANAWVGERLEPWMCAAKQTLKFGENSWDVWVFPEEKPAGLPIGVKMAVDGEMSLVAPMNREDALDGKFLFECRVNGGTMPRFAGVEIIPE